MKILVFDANPQKGTLLDESWFVGAWTAKNLRRFDHKIAATNWPDALDKLLDISKDKKISELHYWGHGNWGKIYMGKKAITVIALTNPLHVWYNRFRELSTRFTENSMVWFRVCLAFGNAGGQLFAEKAAELFGCRVAGSTFIIGPIHGGIHSLHPGQKAFWPVKEGIKIEGEKEIPKRSWITSPNWIFFWTSNIPSDW
jgi:hypothetical protein